MAAIIGLADDKVEALCKLASEGDFSLVVPANYNAPSQVVVAGHAEAVDRLAQIAAAPPDPTLKARKVMPLNVSAPFHCALMKPAETRLAPELRALAANDPRIPVVANVDAQPKLDAGASIDALIAQVSAPVRWEEVVRRLVADGARTFVEIGPGAVLAGLIKKIDRAVTTISVENEDGLEALDALTKV